MDSPGSIHLPLKVELLLGDGRLGLGVKVGRGENVRKYRILELQQYQGSED